ncbi:SDR family NAD(P)-dependent oxidoreductase [Billgrantia montanilacus]|uniref:SDR family NAD(P)-dependent oxidoreductase n=1 Tax=Billgrantia montanilacus TaxID=2282305 RepID=A0A368U0K4_9GAMM|nr:SDR family NAD(P)-dependent oxidoreductase [Halomonas montanilacus]RCV90136.1 SDR family NAD(P)-dependent oxidoreductase [Halomonas montanilacus]
MRIMIVGASQGLGRAFIEGLGDRGDQLIGVSRTMPVPFPERANIEIDWVAADLASPERAAASVAKAVVENDVDVLIYNLGLWESRAFEPEYRFLEDSPSEIQRMVTVNVSGAILLVQALLPALLRSVSPRIILTGSTSALPGHGRPEVTFSASKFALRGIAEALRAGFRDQELAVTCLQLGYLNTEDDLAVPLERAAQRGHGELIPMHDVVHMVRTLLTLSPSSCVKEVVMPAIGDKRF